MGYYINPPDSSKEEFLKKHGRRIRSEDARDWNFGFDGKPSTELPVCLVDNVAMGFTAAAIGFDAEETKRFLNPDGRPKFWFAVDRELLNSYYGGE